MDEVDRAIETLKPDSWKGYTIGDPLFPTKKGSNWRLDDEKLVYPFYEKIGQGRHHDRLHPQGAAARRLREVVAGRLGVRDGLGPRQGGQGLAADQLRHLSLGAAAVHRAARRELAEFEQTGRIDWVTDLAEIPRKYGVSNVYAELGTCFATSAVTHPALRRRVARHAGQRMGADHVVWGHRLGLVRLAAVADRGAAPARDPGRHAEAARLHAARARRRGGEDRDLRWQRRALYGLDPAAPVGAMRADGIDALRTEYQACRRTEKQPALRLRRAVKDARRRSS